jgi:aryl-alcohol dehydrogenase-like predicted oxidoreductase
MLPELRIDACDTSASRLGLGGFHQLEISSEIVEQVVDAFLSEGGNYIETARAYGAGASEEKIGLALAGRRDAVVLCSKTGAASADDARRDLEASLQALQTGYIDFYFLHGVDHEKLQQVTAPGGAVEALTRAREEGLIRGIGLSSHWPEVYLQAMERIDLAVILVWCNYLDNLNFPIIPDRVLPAARQRGVLITAMKPLADGMLYRSAEDALRYCISCTVDLAVCGTNSVEQVRQAARAIREGPATDNEQERILRHAPELGQYVCRRCGRCPDELMDTFRLEGEFDRQMMDFLPHDPAEYALRSRLSGWFNHADLARKQFAETGRNVDGLLAQAGEVDCPYEIDVPRKTRLATAKLTGQSPSRV